MSGPGVAEINWKGIKPIPYLKVNFLNGPLFNVAADGWPGGSDVAQIGPDPFQFISARTFTPTSPEQHLSRHTWPNHSLNIEKGVVVKFHGWTTAPDPCFQFISAIPGPLAQ